MSPTRSTKPPTRFSSRCHSRSAVALTLLLTAPVLFGQATPPAPATPEPSGETVVLDEFVVSGVRASLITAQETKRNALVLVDSIAAQDIGKFPDNSVADALQRVPGIQVGRSEGEVSTVVIRGLPNLGTTLNGHEIFTGTGRGVSLGDIPAELVAGLDVYKTNAPEHIEGGIAGVIDIRLRRPLDFEDRQIAAGGRAIYGEDAEKWSWVGSALVSDRWTTPGGGELGALYATSYQQHHYLDQVSFNFLFEPVPSGGVISSPDIQLPLTQGSLIIPGERRRFAHSASIQFRPSQELELYGDFLYTAYRNKRNVHFLIGFPRFGAIQSAEVYPGTNVPSRLVSTNNFHLTSTQAFSDRTDSYQGVVGAKWQRGAVKASTELVYNWSSFKPRVLIIDTQFRPANPGTFTFNFNNNGRAEMSVSGADLADPNSYYLWGLFDNHGYETSEQIGWRADGEYVFNDGFFKNLKAGVRYTTREAKDRQTSVDDIAPVGGRGVVPTSSIPGFGGLNPTGTFNTYPTQHWFGADPSFLYNNVGQVRQLFGRPAGEPNFNPAIAFTDEEKTYAAYVQAGYSTELAGRPLDGLFGVRVVKTEQELVGYRSNGTPLDQDKEETDVLPMLNARLALKDDLYLRFAAGRSVTRPNFVDLNPIINLNAPTTTGARGTGSGGNPDLDTVKSNQVDLSLEYYFSRSSYASVTGFYREIKGYVETFAELETYDGIEYTITRPRNTGKGELKGLELTYQHFPEFLPEALKGLGVQTNFTYMEGDTDAQDPANPNTPGARVRQPYAQVARRAYNVVAIYERRGFSARLAYNWRGEYTDTFNGPNAAGSPLRQIIVKPRGQLDFSASYEVSDRLTITLDATNILDNKYQDYFHDPDLYPRDTRSYDRTIAIGARFRY